MGLLSRLRAALPWATPADPESLGSILGAALEAAATGHAACPPPVELSPEDALPEPVPAAVTIYHSVSGGSFETDDDLLLTCLARELCYELAARGFDPQAAWETLCGLPGGSIEDLRTIDGWATLSAYLTGGAHVVRLARLEAIA